jgi:segregation and condensation protein B
MATVPVPPPVGAREPLCCDMVAQMPLSTSVLPTEAPGGDHELDLLAKIEALLFVASEPASVEQLAQVLHASEAAVEEALEALAARYQERGLRVQRIHREAQFVTAPEAAEYVQHFLGLDASTRLSSAALEALALVAYRQPVTRAQVEATRGVNCDAVLRTLLSHGLIAPIGRLEQAGRPIVYGTTFQFLQYFGLADLSQLPSLETLASPQGGGEEDEPGRPADETTTE